VIFAGSDSDELPASLDAATVLDTERAGEVLGQSPPAVAKSDEAVAVLDFGFADHALITH
jgi:hypothetical protein